MTSFVHTPSLLCGARNPIAYVVSTTEGAGTPINLKVFTEASFGSDVFTLEIEAEKPADALGQAAFYIEDVIKAKLFPALPSIAATSAQDATGTAIRFHVEANDGTGPIDDSATPKTAVLGGFLPELYPIRTASYPGQLLTIRPTVRQMRYDVPDFLYFLMPGTSLDITLTISYTDATTHVMNETVAGTANAPKYLPIGDAQRDYRQHFPAKTIREIIISATGLPSVRLKPIESERSWVQSYFYLNRLGGIDQLITTGVREEGLEELEISNFKRYLKYNYTNALGEYGTGEPINRKRYKQFTGYLPGGEIESAWHIFTQKKIWLYESGQFLPIIMNGSPADIEKDRQYLKAFSFEYQLAYDL